MSCYAKNLSDKSGRSSCAQDLKKIGVSPGTTGAIAELIVSTNLMQKGYQVFRALSPACFADIVVVKDNRFYKIDVKTGYRYLPTGNIQFALNKNNDRLDYYAVYLWDSDEIVFLTPGKEVVDFAP